MTPRVPIMLIALVFLLPSVSHERASARAHAVQQAVAQKLTFEGDAALWTMAIRPDKTGDFEQIMAKLREGLMKSDDPERRQQLAGWKLMKVSKPMPDGNIAYVHIIQPVVPSADYTIMQVLYDAFPDQRQALYEQYRGAFAQNLALATGSIAVDLSKAQ